jgi:hypothetical protein
MQKARNFERDSRVAAAISDLKNPAVFTQVRGRIVTMTSEGGEESINASAHKYTGKPYAWYGGRKQTRLVVTIEAYRCPRPPLAVDMQLHKVREIRRSARRRSRCVAAPMNRSGLR